MAEHNLLGRIGEDMAAAHLLRNGYRILHRNWRSGRRELDIVAEKEATLVVVEVKTRRNDEYGPAEDALTPMKIRHLVSATDAYVKKYKIDHNIRFDLITLTGENEQNFVLQHIEQAFIPPIW